MDQGAVKKRWGVRFYALAVSIFVHAVAFSIFAAVKLTQSSDVPLQSAAVVNISQAIQLAQTPAITPKPKVISVDWSESEISNFKSQISSFKHTEQSDPRRKHSGAGGPVSAIPNRNYQQSPSGDVRSETAELPAINETQTGQAEFFGSESQGRRICYVVDCSGSMQGLWPKVKAELCESIEKLQQDQYFSVIIFGAGSILESGGGRLTRATGRAKMDAYAFIASVEPRGTTNAFAALEYAVKIRDGSGVGPSVIYFLTDGFELNQQDNARFAHQVATMRNSVSAQTKINTIGFWPDERDKKLLETIAGQSGGRFTLVGQMSGNK